jgi:isopropylmalate/homocitrate/citramalate synthase
VKITICEVGPRDGLQNEPDVLAPAVRAEFIDRLAQVGLPRIEATSFVSPRRVPQMADAEHVVEGIHRKPGTVYAGLVLNERGYERQRALGLEEVRFALACTETFNRRNSNASTAELATAARQVIARAKKDGVRPVVCLIVSFGCPFEGEVRPERPLGLAQELISAGAEEVLFADTIGVAVPARVRALVGPALGLGVPVGLHLHNTRSTGFANAYAGMEAGATVLDASVGGIGGCPFAPRASGNIATEDLIYMLNGEGVETGVDLGGALEVAAWLEGVLGRTLPGQVYRAGAFAPVSGPL